MQFRRSFPCLGLLLTVFVLLPTPANLAHARTQSKPAAKQSHLLAASAPYCATVIATGPHLDLSKKQVRCATCVSLNLALAVTVAAFAAPLIGSAGLSTLLASKFGISLTAASAAANGMYGTALAAVMCKHVC